jgi:hypothetical protein
MFGKKALFSKDVMGAWVIVEKHDAGCTCSYCANAKKEKRNIFLWFPKNKSSNSWRVLGWKKQGCNFFYRTTLAKWTRFFGFDFTRWSNGFRIYILPAIWSNPNTEKSFLTFAYNSPFKTKIPNVESFLWMNMIKYECHDESSIGASTCANIQKKDV